MDNVSCFVQRLLNPFRGTLHTIAYELWLLDTEAMPLALLHSAVFDYGMDLHQNIDWRAGLACRECFSTDVMQQIASSPDAAVNATDNVAATAGEYTLISWRGIRRLRNGFTVIMTALTALVWVCRESTYLPRYKAGAWKTRRFRGIFSVDKGMTNRIGV